MPAFDDIKLGEKKANVKRKFAECVLNATVGGPLVIERHCAAAGRGVCLHGCVDMGRPGRPADLAKLVTRKGMTWMGAEAKTARGSGVARS